MQKKAGLGFVLVVMAAGLFGCSTAPRRQEVRASEPSSANLVQSQNAQAAQAAETERLRQALSQQQEALAQAEAEKRELEEKLNSALDSKKVVVQKTESSYLK